MEKEICLRCGGKMEHMGQEELQLGKYGFLLGSWNHLLSGALKVDIYCCRGCKKMEFYAVDTPWGESEDSMAKIPCPHCGQLHEKDDLRCPGCGEWLLGKE